MSERKTGLPSFSVGATVFTCWTSGDGGAAQMVWRCADRRCAVGRVIVDHQVEIDGEMVTRKRALGWARLDEELIGRDFADLKTAMIAAATALHSIRIAA